MRKLLLSLVIAFFGVTDAKADHNSAYGSVERLQYETQELQNAVRYSPINYQVKYAVDNFTASVYRLANCAAYGNYPGSIGCPDRCRRELEEARWSFADAERYLRDTYYDFPGVYQAYQDVRQALYAIQIGGGHGPGPHPGPGPGPHPGPGPGPHPGPGPGPHPGPGPGPGGMIRCVAVDGGWEEHGGGHLGFGRFIQEAQRQALYECQRFHGRCRIRSCN